MPTLNDAVSQNITHLLLIGHTKTGKTDYCAQAAKAGFTLFYIDADNGLSTLLEAIGDDSAARSRVHYFNPNDIADFLEGVLTKPIFRYNINRRAEFASMSSSPDERIVEIIPSRIPPNVIMAVDTWTSVANAAMTEAARRRQIDLTDIDKFTREIYGPAGFRVTRIAEILQSVRFNVIVQAHPGIYERKEKPPNRIATDIKESDMIIRDTLEIPISTSMPNGATLGKYFNQIGWLTVNRWDKRELDFTTKNGRLGGGTPNRKGDPREELSWARTFGAHVDLSTPSTSTWLNEMSVAQFKEAQAAAHANRPVLKTGALKPAASAPAKPAPPSTGLKLPAGLKPSVQK